MAHQFARSRAVCEVALRVAQNTIMGFLCEYLMMIPTSLKISRELESVNRLRLLRVEHRIKNIVIPVALIPDDVFLESHRTKFLAKLFSWCL